MPSLRELSSVIEDGMEQRALLGEGAEGAIKLQTSPLEHPNVTGETSPLITQLRPGMSLREQSNIIEGLSQSLPPIKQGTTLESVTGDIGEVLRNTSIEDLQAKGSSLMQNQRAVGELIPDMDLASGLDETIGLGESFPLRTRLSFDDTKLEENASLEKSFGVEDEGWFRDAKGTVFIHPEGLAYGGYDDKRSKILRQSPLRLDRIGPEWGDIADISSDALEIGVPVAASIMTGGTGIPAAFYRAYNVMRAAAATKTAEEGVEALLGNNQQSADEVINNIGTYTLSSGLFELGGSSMNAIFRRVFTGPKTTRRPLMGKSIEEILSDMKTGKFSVAWSKIPENLKEEVVKGVTRGIEKARGKVGQVARGTTGAIKGVKAGLEKSVDQTKVGFGPVGQLKQIATPKQERLTEELRKFGGRPKVDRATKGPLLGKLQSFTDFVTGLKKERGVRNIKAIAKKKAALEKEVGGGERLVNRKLTIQKAQEKAQFAVRTEERAAIRTERQTAERFKQADAAVDRAVERAIFDLKGTIGKVGSAGKKVKEGIEKAKTTFSKRASESSKQIDALAGNKPIIYLKNTKLAIQDILQKGIKARDGSTIQIRGEGKKYLQDVLNKGEAKQTFKSMTEFLSEMTSAANNPNLVGDITHVHAQAVKTAIMKDMNNAVLGSGPRAVREWMQFRRWYKHNVAKFDDVAITDLVRDIRVGGLEPSKIVARIKGFKSVEQVAKIKRALRDPKQPYAKQDTWEMVKREVLETEIAKATDKSGLFNPAGFRNNVLEMEGVGKKGLGRVFTAIFDKDAKLILELSEELAKKNQIFKLPMKEAKEEIKYLTSGGFKDALQDKLTQIAIKESKFKKGGIDTVIKEIAKKENEDIAAYLMQKGKFNDIKDARKFYGENSKEWKALKFSSVKTVLNKIIQNTDDPLERAVSGTYLLKEIQSIRREVVEMFGEKTYRSWIEFAEMAANVSTKMESKSAGGMIAAASIPLHPLANISKVGQLNLMGRIFLSSDGLDYFTRGLTKGIGSPFMRKTGTLATKTAAQTFNVEFNKFLTKLITDNREDFKVDFPTKLSIPEIRKSIKENLIPKE